MNIEPLQPNSLFLEHDYVYVKAIRSLDETRTDSLQAIATRYFAPYCVIGFLYRGQETHWCLWPDDFWLIAAEYQAVLATVYAVQPHDHDPEHNARTWIQIL